MRVVEVREQSVPLSRFASHWRVSPVDLDTTVVALVSDVVQRGRPVVGFGFGSFGRHSVGGLVRGRFGDRLLAAFGGPEIADAGRLDPFAVWRRLMHGEKPGGHGERNVAVGCLDMALWDLAAKLADLPLHALLARRLGRIGGRDVRVYAGVGYRWPGVDHETDIHRLVSEVVQCLEQGHTFVKMKIAERLHGPEVDDFLAEDDDFLAEDMERIEAVIDTVSVWEAGLALDAMGRYSREQAVDIVGSFGIMGLEWLEDICDPLDYESLALVAQRYRPPLAAGECLFSLADARNLLRYGGLRADRDKLVFDPVHCYGLPEYLRIVELFEAVGWSRQAFWPHGGHLFSLHAAGALGLGGSEVNPFAFAPFGVGHLPVIDGRIRLPDAPGIGFEAHPGTAAVFGRLVEGPRILR